MYETEYIPNRNKLWLLSTLASFIVLVTAVLWTLWLDLSRENFFIGVYLADTLYLVISGTWYRIQAKPMFSSSVAELTWVLWDSSWGWMGVCQNFTAVWVTFYPALYTSLGPLIGARGALSSERFFYPTLLSLSFI